LTKDEGVGTRRFQWLSAAVLFSDDRCDRVGEVTGWSGDGDARG